MGDEKALREAIRQKNSLLIAFSGGLDSTVIAKLAVEELGENAIAVTIDSETMPKAELDACRNLVKEIGIGHIVIKRSDLKDERFTHNPVDRCYFCRQGLALELKNIAQEHSITVIADGANASDLDDYRPGLTAFNEAGIWHPFIEFVFTKNDIRELAGKLNLSITNKPSMACLASRISYHDKITEEKLRRIENAEAYLQSLAFTQVRVRHLKDNVARIEVLLPELSRLLDAKIRQDVVTKLKELGFKHVTIDLEGYRTGSMNVGIETNRLRE